MELQYGIMAAIASVPYQCSLSFLKVPIQAEAVVSHTGISLKRGMVGFYKAAQHPSLLAKKPCKLTLSHILHIHTPARLHKSSRIERE
jgi:hypothetical protein